MRILVIEDDLDCQELYRATLQLSSFVNSSKIKYSFASNGKDGLFQAQQMAPNLILLDMVLPDLSGLEVLKLLKYHYITCHIPVLVVTALAFTEDKQRILAAGASGYLSKPYILKELDYLLENYFLG